MENPEYSLMDLLMKDSFVEWVKRPDPENEKYWQSWIAENRVSEDLIREARNVILGIEKTNRSFSPEYLNSLWDRLNIRISEKETPVRRKLIHFTSPKTLYGIAASIAFVVIAAVTLLLIRNATSVETYASGYGEIRSVYLPDSSLITLNSNSSITYTRFKEGKAREVWLTGEAYFKVRKGKMQETFTVYTSNYDIEVLGTEFNVLDRSRVSEVVLSSGKILLKNFEYSDAREMILKPGDLVRVDQAGELVKKEVNPSEYKAWTDGKLRFHKTALQDVIKKINELYDLDIRFADRELAKLTYTGTLILASDTPEVLLELLKESFDIEAKRQGKKIILHSKK